MNVTRVLVNISFGKILISIFFYLHHSGNGWGRFWWSRRSDGRTERSFDEQSQRGTNISINATKYPKTSRIQSRFFDKRHPKQFTANVYGTNENAHDVRSKCNFQSLKFYLHIFSF